MNILFVSASTVFLIAYAFYNTITLTEYFKEVSAINDEKCHKVDGPSGIEDIIQYGEYIIGGSDNNLEASVSNEQELKELLNGQMVSLNTMTNTIAFLAIENFPNDVPFHPHGLFLYRKEYIYVINHSFTKGERIEVLKISNSPLRLIYIRSIILPEGFNRITNDLVVIDKDEFYITTSNAIGKDTTGSIIKRNLFNYVNFFSILFRIRLTYVYHYKNHTMTKVPYSNSIFNNGIEYDKDNHLLYIAQTMQKRIRVLKIKSSDLNGIDVQLVRDINLQYATHNISYDAKRGVIIAAVIGKVYHTIQLSKHYSQKGNIDIDEIYGGAIEIDIKNKDEVKMLVLNENKLKGVSSGIRLNGYLYLSSSVDNGLLICPI